MEKIWNREDVNEVSWNEFQSNIERAAGYYENITGGDLASSYCYLMHLQGKAAEYVQQEFHKLDDRLQTAAEEELTFFAPYRMYVFEFITSYLLFAINLEGILAAVIVTLYSIDLERSSRTMVTVYSTRKGKNIIRDKLFAAAAASFLCFTLIAAITFFLAGCAFPSGTIRDTLISNPMVTLKGVPCIARETMTIGTYIFKSLGMSCILTILYSLGSFALGVRVKNGYFAFGILMILLSIMKVLSAAAPTSTNLFFWMQYNPLDLVLKAGTWYLYSSNNFSPPAYEASTLAIWFAVCIVGCIYGLVYVKRKKVTI